MAFYAFCLNIFIITNTCGNVIAANIEKNKALKIVFLFKSIYKPNMPASETNQYTKAVLKYKTKFLKLYFPYKNLI